MVAKNPGKLFEDTAGAGWVRVERGVRQLDNRENGIEKHSEITLLETNIKDMYCRDLVTKI